jgi:hypothetical protein
LSLDYNFFHFFLPRSASHPPDCTENAGYLHFFG